MNRTPTGKLSNQSPATSDINSCDRSLVTKTLLSPEEVLNGYDAVSALYPYIPSVSLWRAWEYAAYKRYTLQEPVVDIGCGDGRFFRLVWPDVNDAVGVDIDEHVIQAARNSGVYRSVHLTAAHLLPFQPASFGSAFANCSLEHMDDLPQVLGSIHACLRPGGLFLLSVVTDNFLHWDTLSLLERMIGDSHRADELQSTYRAYHHLVNPLSQESWIEHLVGKGFELLDVIPVLPEMTSRLFLFIDHLWHVARNGGELGDMLYSYLKTLPEFPVALRQILSGVLLMEKSWSMCSGAVFCVRRKYE